MEENLNIHENFTPRKIPAIRYLHYNMPFWGVVMGVVNIIMGVARGRYHQLPVGVAIVPEGSLKKLEPMNVTCAGTRLYR